MNMGDKLNSIRWENRLMVTSDGKYMFFVSGRRHELLNDELENGRYTSVTGFYWVDAAFIQELKKRMLGSLCAAEIVSKEYEKYGVEAAVCKLTELMSEAGDSCHFSYFELLMICREMIREDKIDDADIFYQALLDTLEEDFRTTHGYGMICMKHGRISKGWKLMKKALSEYPVELTVAVYILGSELLRMSRTEEALEIMRLNAGEFPGHYLSHFGLARAYEKLGNVERAIKICEEALQLCPDYHPAEDLLDHLKKRLNQ